jgi:hypothetical protein
MAEPVDLDGPLMPPADFMLSDLDLMGMLLCVSYVAQGTTVDEAGRAEAEALFDRVCLTLELTFLPREGHG